MTDDRTAVLIQAALDARKQAYAPFSKFYVGAALETATGEIFAGCNVENSSYGMTICAERVAVGAAIVAGYRDFARVVVAAESKASPCGACRQVIHEFGPDALVISTCANPARREMPLTDLLPGAFGPSHLSGGRPRRPRRRG